jgi:hypothetical protein
MIERNEKKSYKKKNLRYKVFAKRLFRVSSFQSFLNKKLMKKLMIRVSFLKIQYNGRRRKKKEKEWKRKEKNGKEWKKNGKRMEKE